MFPRIALRRACPTPSDGVLFARYLDTSADGLFGLMLGPESERVVAKAYVVPDHGLSFEHVTFALREDIVVGMVSAYSSEQHGRSTDAPLKRAAGWRIIRLGAVSVAVGRVLRFLGDIPDGDFYLQAVALDSESQGEGVGTVLIEHAQNRAMEKPADRFTLHVAVENTVARRLYERLGMRIEATSPKSFPCPGCRCIG